MKKTFTIIRFAMLCIVLAAIPSLTSCKKEVSDTTGLLSTVPSSASAVVGLNIRTMLEKAGCKVDGADITPGEVVEGWLARKANSTASENEAMRLVLSGESGIDPVGAIFFVDAYNSYLTAMLADTGKFQEFVEKQSGQKFTEADGVKTCGNVAMSGAQMWVCLSSQATIDPKAVKNYSALDESQSFMSNPYSADIAGMTDDIVGLVQTGLISSGRSGSFIGAAKTNMALGLLFEDASAFAMKCNFLKGKMELRAEVFNSKGETAKFLLPTSKIDTDLVKSLGSQAEAVMVLSISKDLMKKIDQAGSSLGGNMFGAFIKMFGSIDGTVAAAVSDLDNFSDGLSGAVTTDGNPSNDLMQLLSQFGATRKDGKVVRITNGTPKGSLEMSKAADYFKGAMIGIMINADASDLGGPKEGLKTLAFSLAPEGKGITASIDIEGTDPAENMLVTLIKNNK